MFSIPVHLIAYFEYSSAYKEVNKPASEDVKDLDVRENFVKGRALFKEWLRKLDLNLFSYQ